MAPDDPHTLGKEGIPSKKTENAAAPVGLFLFT
jgi:hypothetical protein